MYICGYWYHGDNRQLAINLAKFYSKKLGYRVFALQIVTPTNFNQRYNVRNQEEGIIL